MNDALVPLRDLRRRGLHDGRRPLEPLCHELVLRLDTQDMGLALFQCRQLLTDLTEMVQVPLDALLAVRFIHELVEAAGEITDGPLNVREAQDLAGDRSQLLDHLRDDAV